MKGLLTTVLALMVLAYPLAVWWGLVHWQPRAVALVLAVLVAARFLLVGKADRENLRRLLPLVLAVLACCLAGVVLNSKTALLFNPCLANLVMLGTFAWTLRHPPSMAERFARLRHRDLPAHAVDYCRRVTFVWCAFFVLNGSVALCTVFQPMAVWTLYNALVSYVLIGLLAAVEYLVRRHHMAAHAAPNPVTEP